MASATLGGFLLGAGLIIAIGAQNAFVLRMGLKRRHVLAICLVCSLSDALLIAAGVAGLGRLVAAAPALLRVVAIAGAIFLAGYGLLAVRRALRRRMMAPAEEAAGSLAAALAACVGFTFLNPHVYLDTVVLVGGLSARYPGAERAAFAAGAAVASFVWFFTLGYGARLLAPAFANPRAWRLLDAAVAAVMFALAWQVLSGTTAD